MSLAATRDHCRRMARQEPDVALWAILADEIDAYLNGELQEAQPTDSDIPMEFPA